MRELLDSDAPWPTRDPVDIPLYRPALEEEEAEGEGMELGNGDGIHGESWRPRVLLPKYHAKYE